MRTVHATFSEGLFETIAVQVGRLTMTAFSAVGSALISGFWSFWSQHNLPQDVLYRKSSAGDILVQRLGQEVLVACGVVLLIALVFSLTWLVFVWRNPPASPRQATRYRAYWLMFLLILLGCTAVFYLALLHLPALSAQFPQISRNLLSTWQTALLAALALSAFVFWYIMSLFRTPATTIAAVPLGSYVARLRWR